MESHELTAIEPITKDHGEVITLLFNLLVWQNSLKSNGTFQYIFFNTGSYLLAAKLKDRLSIVALFKLLQEILDKTLYLHSSMT